MQKFIAFVSGLLIVGLAAPVLAFAETVPMPIPSGISSASPSPTVVVKPGKIGELSIEENEIGSLKLSWVAPMPNGSLPIIDYRINYKFDQYSTWILWKHAASTATEITIPDLPLGLGYSFSVRAVTANATSIATSIHLSTPTPLAPAALNRRARAQYTFVAATWNATSSAKFGFLSGTDCANWASQSLLKRGYRQSALWRGRVSRTIGATKPWISSTALQGYLLDSGRATALTDSQRELVSVGDLVQFDWWNKGAQEHTGVVTYIDRTPTGVKIYYASHTAAGMWWSVDRSIQVIHPGATASYLHLSN